MWLDIVCMEQDFKVKLVFDSVWWPRGYDQALEAERKSMSHYVHKQVV